MRPWGPACATQSPHQPSPKDSVRRLLRRLVVKVPSRCSTRQRPPGAAAMEAARTRRATLPQMSVSATTARRHLTAVRHADVVERHRTNRARPRAPASLRARHVFATSRVCSVQVVPAWRPRCCLSHDSGGALRARRLLASIAGVTGEELEADTVVGDRYRLHRRLGEGAMGFVWEASHVFTHARFALKFLKGARERTGAASSARSAPPPPCGIQT